MDSDIGNQAFGVGFCRQAFTLKTWLGIYYMKGRRFARKKQLARIHVNARKRIARYLVGRSGQAQSLLDSIVSYCDKTLTQVRPRFVFTLSVAKSDPGLTWVNPPSELGQFNLG